MKVRQKNYPQSEQTTAQTHAPRHRPHLARFKRAVDDGRWPDGEVVVEDLAGGGAGVAAPLPAAGSLLLRPREVEHVIRRDCGGRTRCGRLSIGEPRRAELLEVLIVVRLVPLQVSWLGRPGRTLFQLLSLVHTSLHRLRHAVTARVLRLARVRLPVDLWRWRGGSSGGRASSIPTPQRLKIRHIRPAPRHWPSSAGEGPCRDGRLGWGGSGRGRRRAGHQRRSADTLADGDVRPGDAARGGGRDGRRVRVLGVTGRLRGRPRAGVRRYRCHRRA